MNSDQLARLRAAFTYEPEQGILTHLATGREITGPNRHKWRRKYMAAAEPTYESVPFEQERFVATRVIWFLLTNEWPPRDKVMDHINGDTHDNRACNLRLVTRSENGLNNETRRLFPKGRDPIPKHKTLPIEPSPTITKLAAYCYDPDVIDIISQTESIK